MGKSLGISNMLKLIHISDTHLLPFPKDMEAGDILVHSGDCLNYGEFTELPAFRKQLEDIKDNYKLIVLTPGNHDWTFFHNPVGSTLFLKETVPNLEVLIDSTIEWNSQKIHGNSWQPYFCNWAFNIQNPETLAQKYEAIPEDVDILVTHCPPKGILDRTIWDQRRVGSPELACRLQKLKQLKAHMFGHIHCARGMEFINDIYYSNGAICNEQYFPIHNANVIELGDKVVQEIK